jgi:hypothetical protein
MTERLNLGQLALLITDTAGMAGLLLCGLMRHDRPDSQSLGRCRGV